MPLIAIRIPRGNTAVFPGLEPLDLPWVAGECGIDGYNYMILADQVEWRTRIAEDEITDTRRTVHLPSVDCVRICRAVDRATSRLTKMALTSHVTTLPWELYFLRVLGDDLAAEALAALARTAGVGTGRFTCFMTMKLYDPLISKYDFSFGEGQPRENLEVSASAIEWTYHLTDSSMAPCGTKGIRYELQPGCYSQPWSGLP